MLSEPTVMEGLTYLLNSQGPLTLQVRWAPAWEGMRFNPLPETSVSVPVQYQSGPEPLFDALNLWGILTLPERRQYIGTVIDHEVLQRDVAPAPWPLRLLKRTDKVFDRVRVEHHHYDVETALGMSVSPGYRHLEVLRRPDGPDLGHMRYPTRVCYDLTHYVVPVSIPRYALIDGMREVSLYAQHLLDTMAFSVAQRVLGRRLDERGLVAWEAPKELPEPRGGRLGKLWADTVWGSYLREPPAGRTGEQSVEHHAMSAYIPGFDLSPEGRHPGTFLEVSHQGRVLGTSYLLEARAEAERMMGFVSPLHTNCPSCGGPLPPSSRGQARTCGHCGTVSA